MAETDHYMYISLLYNCEHIVLPSYLLTGGIDILYNAGTYNYFMHMTITSYRIHKRGKEYKHQNKNENGGGI